MMTNAHSSTEVGSRAATCKFPGCGRPVRERAGEGGGKPPIYCDQLNPVTGKLAHTPLTAARERARRERQGSGGQPGLAGEAPASAARDRAVGLLEQFRTAGEQLTDTLVAAIEAMTSAGDPESVSAELAAARRQVDRARLEADERVQVAESARGEALTEQAAARQAVAEAAAARDEAITELDALDATLAATRAELEQVRTEYTVELDQFRAEADRQLAAVRAEAAEQVGAAQQWAAEQVRAVQAEAHQRVQAAEAARDQAAAEASAARQAAADATNRAEEARAELRQARTEHREELTGLRQDHREELAAERSRSDTALDSLRAEHRRETEVLQAALTAVRTIGVETTEQRERTRPQSRADQGSGR